MAVQTAFRIEPIDTSRADEALLRRVVALQQAFESEEVSEDPPKPYAVVAADLRARSAKWVRSEWAAFAGDEIVGYASFVENRSGSNEHIRELYLYVHPDLRRRGIGRALFAEGVRAIPEGRWKLLEWWTSSRIVAAEAVSKHLGAKPGLRMRVSQVDLRAIDRALLERWAAIDPKGYRLEWVTGDLPDRLVRPALEAFNAINRMPREDLEMDDWKFTEENHRDWERVRRERGQDMYLALAIEEASGKGVAFSDVVFDRRYLHVIHQGGTAVDLEHQGRSLGKWIKARMALRILEEFPQARVIRTDNAGTNAKMLAINDQMGFKEAWWGTVWQLPLEEAGRYVETHRS